MNEFDDIRPYCDDEVKETVDRLCRDDEFIRTITKFRFSKWPSFCRSFLIPFVKNYISKQAKSIHSIHDLQLIAEGYLKKMIDQTTTGVTVSGAEYLDTTKAHLFISNHRDIAVDPAIVNWALHHHGHSTLNVAIGDNLLSKPFVSDLMRLNKSFIVNRSATAPREKLKAAKHLAAYIYHCIVGENFNIWIAQREGRAKDGLDKTNSAVIKMLTLNKPKAVDFSDYVREFNIIPVSISYERDPCDIHKAQELYVLQQQGTYEKTEHEDAESIARGITGYKGRVHVSFGEALQGHYENTDDIVAALDKAIVKNYVLQPSNCIAYQELHGKLPEGVAVTDQQLSFHKEHFVFEKQQFHKHIAECDPRYRELLLNQYANPVISQQAVLHAEH